MGTGNGWEAWEQYLSRREGGCCLSAARSNLRWYLSHFGFLSLICRLFPAEAKSGPVCVARIWRLDFKSQWSPARLVAKQNQAMCVCGVCAGGFLCHKDSRWEGGSKRRSRSRSSYQQRYFIMMRRVVSSSYTWYIIRYTSYIHRKINFCLRFCLCTAVPLFLFYFSGFSGWFGVNRKWIENGLEMDLNRTVWLGSVGFGTEEKAAKASGGGGGMPYVRRMVRRIKAMFVGNR